MKCSSMLIPHLRRLGALLVPFLALLGSQEGEIITPRLTDPRLELSLFASEPDIVTPIGVAVDKRRRIFVVESHTHLPRADYPGPRFDRVKLFEDRKSEG